MHRLRRISSAILLLVFGVSFHCQAQQMDKDTSSFFQPAKTFDKKRFYMAGGLGATAYVGFSIGFYQAWYKNYDQSAFHTFNDWGEWEHMDKAGHVFSGYFQSLIVYKGAKWTGMSDKKAIWTGIGAGMLFQSTIEIMDGFSTKWGFSIPDISANILGVTSFGLQQHFWGEQRISFKESAWPQTYDNPTPIFSSDGSTSITIGERQGKLFGTSWGERALKDYNAQTYWASVNVKSFLAKDAKWPAWLNIAVGYGADGMLGGFNNQWTDVDGHYFNADPVLKRRQQFYIGLDYDLTKLKVKNHFLKSVFSVLNIVKLPAPALEINSSGELIFHFLAF